MFGVTELQRIEIAQKEGNERILTGSVVIKGNTESSNEEDVA